MHGGPYGSGITDPVYEGAGVIEAGFDGDEEEIVEVSVNVPDSVPGSVIVLNIVVVLELELDESVNDPSPVALNSISDAIAVESRRAKAHILQCRLLTRTEVMT